AALKHAQEQQKKRDRELLAKRITKRDRRLLEEKIERAAVPDPMRLISEISTRSGAYATGPENAEQIGVRNRRKRITNQAGHAPE
ncbi:MAG: hypothetical protein OXU20_22455, partial [Myxococcales bacterium]|nr:hypothetical protein [Myxococcales bacterium]